jgi:hypothetical protein
MPHGRQILNAALGPIGLVTPDGASVPAAAISSSPCRATWSPNKRHGQILFVRGWRCRYDMQTGTFDVPPEFKEHNAKAIGPDTK